MRKLKKNKQILILHPGFAKSGTTTIQNHFNHFQNTTNLFYENKISQYNSITFKLFCLKKNKVNNKKNLHKFINLINKNLEKKNTKTTEAYVYSFEGIFNNIRFDEKQNFNNFFYIVNKLKKNFKIKILLSVRNQIEIINSLYASHYGILFKKYPDVDRFIEKEILNNNKKIDLYNFKFMYDFIFTMTKIKPDIIFYEDLKYNPKKYIHNLSKILENKNKIKLKFKNYNKTRTSNNKFIFYSGNFFYVISKINSYLKKRIFFFEFLTSKIVLLIKKIIPTKLVKKSSNYNNLKILKKYYKSNQHLFKLVKYNKKEKNYRKYFYIK